MFKKKNSPQGAWAALHEGESPYDGTPIPDEPEVEPEVEPEEEPAAKPKKKKTAKKEKAPKAPKAPKTPKEHGKAAFLRTKSFLGIVCLVLGCLICFAVVPVLKMATVKTVDVVTFTQAAPAGMVITQDMVKTVEMSQYHLPVGAITELSDVIGKYLSVDAAAGDFATPSRVSNTYPGSDPELLDLPEGKMAISISLSNLAQSVSGKLRQGDIVQLFASSGDAEQAMASAPLELQYVEVLSATYSDGSDVDLTAAKVAGKSNVDSTNYLTHITLLVNARQAAVLAGLDHNSTVYAALVVRGNEERKQAALAMQEALFVEEEAENIADAAAQPESVPESTQEGE